MRRLVIAVILLSSAIFGVIAPGYPEMVDRLVAVVNGEPITLGMVEDEINVVWSDTQKNPESRREALESLIDHKLKLQEARRLGIMVSEESLSNEVANLAARFASPEEFAKALRQRGITQVDLEEALLKKVMIREMVNRKFLLFVDVTDLDASEYFEQHRDELIIPELVHLDQIFFQLDPNGDEEAKKAVKARAEAALSELKDGVDFSKYTSEKADYIALNYSYLPVDELPVPVVSAAVSQLNAGSSELIETPAGYFVIRLNDRRPARQARFDEIKDKIKERLIQQKTEADLKAWLEKQRATADIRIKVSFQDGDVKN